MKKKIIALGAVLALTLGLLTACGGGGTIDGFDSRREITVVSREEGSGTRGAFVELMGVEVLDDAGTRDMTTPEAVIANGTSIVLSNVTENPYAIGYISLGALNDNVTALQINGAHATAANIIAGAYPVQRAFNIAWLEDELTDLARDFIGFMLSAEGQEVVSGGYISSVQNAPAYTGGGLAGRIVVSGSTSVAPVMERLAEAYEALNPGVIVEVHSTGSTAGIVAATNGTADIGMASRDLREAELEQLTGAVVAFDGIAIIVNNSNPLVGLTAEQVRQIFTGEITRWSEVS